MADGAILMKPAVMFISFQ